MEFKMMETFYASRGPLAIQCRDIEFGYSAKKPVLQKLSMHVPEGSIYSLLGASSSGKTTLIKIITNTLRATSGEVIVFGQPVGSSRCAVPGKGLGYMPQDLCLYPYFSIESTLTYFARINGMNGGKIKERILFLQQYLELPDPQRSIAQLSGGQQRRVSLAVALIHSPQLMILDEPTVGIDPVLRAKIWNFLRELRKTGHTIFVTTHYIEETVTSDLISYIRNGQLICELKPQMLMSLYSSLRLESAVYELCRRQDALFQEKSSADKASKEGQSILSLKWFPSISDIPFMYTRPGAFHLNSFSVVTQRTWRLLACDWFNLFMMLLYPAMNIFMIYLAFYQRPGVHVATVNNFNFNEHSNLSFSDKLMYSLAQHTHLTFVNQTEQIEYSIQQGKSVAGLSLGDDFTECFADRIKEGVRVSDETIDCSQIRIYIDTSHFIKFWLLVLSLANSFKQVFLEYLPRMGANARAYLPAIEIIEATSGKEVAINFDMEAFFVPGQMLGLSFMLTLVMAGLLWLKDRENGIFERSQVHRVSPFQFFLAHLFVQVVIMFASNIVLVFSGVFLFGLKINFNLAVAYLLLNLVTVSTILMGQLVALTSSCHMTYLTKAATVTFPCYFISGAMWPIESINYSLVRSATELLPLNRPIIAMRALVSRNLSPSNPLVYNGFLTAAFYIAVTFALCLMRLSR